MLPYPSLQVGRLLRASTSGFIVGCQVGSINQPSLGALVRVPLDGGYQVYGIIQDIQIDDDGLVRQLVTAAHVDASVVADNRYNRNVPVEMNALSVGYCQGDIISHLLPPKPPLSLDTIYLCNHEEIRTFTSSPRFGYFRHLLRMKEYPLAEILAAHLQQAYEAQKDQNPQWITSAVQEIIILLRDDYSTLAAVLSALGDALPQTWQEGR